MSLLPPLPPWIQGLIPGAAVAAGVPPATAGDPGFTPGVIAGAGAAATSSGVDLPSAISQYFAGYFALVGPLMLRVGVFLVSLLLVIIGFIVIVRPA